nr:MAG TPA: hypothetical protein [Bacteriophage sp.]
MVIKGRTPKHAPISLKPQFCYPIGFLSYSSYSFL